MLLILNLLLIWKVQASSEDLGRMCALARAVRSGADVAEVIRWNNGQFFVASNGQGQVTWYWESGQIMTNQAGIVGANWYWEAPPGQGQQLMTADAGIRGKTWTWSNQNLFSNQVGVVGTSQFFPDGRLITTSALGVSDDDLLYPACYLAMLLL